MITRKIKKTDYNGLIKLWTSLKLKSKYDTKKRILSLIKKNPETCFVVFEKGELIASVLGVFDGRQGSIYHLALRKDFREKGIGKSLLSKVEKKMKKLGAFKVFLYCEKKLVGYYKKNGYDASKRILMKKLL